ncbi:methionine adenosyltransferase 2 subunit beta-like, partial [Antrostomus carolinensis]|uniref:methionine adenosyltransferase 2 subunit beta-like n=1 Tax=Antrostomus carolinensis TaxID=279965 RepID=UPI000528DB45
EDVDIPSRRVLITGATGLLGRAVFKEFSENNWNAVGCGYRRARPRFEQINLLDSVAVHDIIHDFQPHVIVHCAAERRPDVVESQPDAASQLNVAASGNLAKEAAGVGAFLIYISTDYVFDGTSPPYKESDVPNPLNLYGKTKLDGEKAVLENNE